MTGQPGKGTLTVHLPEEQEVTAFEWSRDGVPYAGESGRGYAWLLPWPLAFVIETSRDGETWTEAYATESFDITPEGVSGGMLRERLRARRSLARLLTTRRVAGSRDKRSASLVSGYPARRL